MAIPCVPIARRSLPCPSLLFCCLSALPHLSPCFMSPLPPPLLLHAATLTPSPVACHHSPTPSPGVGVPPCVLSFVHPPGCPHTLPSATHTDIASMWEEPCLAFVRLVVSTVDLGPAAATAAAMAADGSSDAVSSRSSKAVLQRLTGLLRGDAAVEEVGGVLSLELGFCWGLRMCAWVLVFRWPGTGSDS